MAVPYMALVDLLTHMRDQIITGTRAQRILRRVRALHASLSVSRVATRLSGAGGTRRNGPEASGTLKWFKDCKNYISCVPGLPL